MDSSVGATAITVKLVELLTAPTDAVIVVVPTPEVVACPVPLTLATAGLEELQVAVAVTSCVLPSVKVAVAENCGLAPSITTPFPGLMAMETSCGPLTVRTVEPATAPSVAVMVAVPTPALVAKPCVPRLLLMMATVAALEVQVAEAVRFWVLPSVNVPRAVNGCAVPRGIEGFCGATAIVTKAAGVTVRLAEPEIAPEAAVIVVTPVPRLLARPMVGAESLTVATPADEEVQ